MNKSITTRDTVLVFLIVSISVFAIVFGLISAFSNIAKADDEEATEINSEIVELESVIEENVDADDESIPAVNEEDEEYPDETAQADTQEFTEEDAEEDSQSNDNCLTFTMTKASNISIAYYNDVGSLDLDLQTKINDGDWTNYNIEYVISLNANDVIQFRGNNPDGFNTYDIKVHFVIDGEAEASGSVMSLVDQSGQSDSIPSDYCFSRLFYGCKGLIKCPQLTATQLKRGCYYYMFQNSGVKDIPILQTEYINTSRVYEGMFCDCDSLTNANHELDNKILVKEDLSDNTFNSMFSSCSKLINTPNFPNLQIISHSAFKDCFWHCNSLKYACDITGLTLKQSSSLHFYGMFDSCYVLEDPPKISVNRTYTNYYIYQNMFAKSGITHIKLEDVKLLGHDYEGMFSECSNLNTIEVAFDSWKSYAAQDYESFTDNWVYKVAENGTFICPEGLEKVFDTNHIPNGWDVVTKKDLTYDMINIEHSTLIFNGSEQTLDIKVYDGSEDVTQYFDISGNKATNVGTYEWTVSGKKDYSLGHIYVGSLSYYWRIAEAAGDDIIYDAFDFETYYDGLEHGISLDVVYPEDGYSILYSTDGQSYSENVPTIINVGNQRVYFKITAPFCDDVSGNKEITINKKQAGAVVTGEDTKTYGELPSVNPSIIITEFQNVVEGEEDLIEYDYKISGDHIVNTPDSVSVVIKDSEVTKNYDFDVVSTAKIKYKKFSDYENASVFGIDEEYQYTGESICPKPEVRYTFDNFEGNSCENAYVVFEEGKDYSVEYENNTEIGTAKAIIRGLEPNCSPDSVIETTFEIVGEPEPGPTPVDPDNPENVNASVVQTGDYALVAALFVFALLSCIAVYFYSRKYEGNHIK